MTEKQIAQGKQFFLDCFHEFEWLDDTTFIIPSKHYEKYCKAKGLHQEIRDSRTFEFLMDCFGREANEALDEFLSELKENPAL